MNCDQCRKGGLTTAGRYGKEHMREIGKRGGQATAMKYGKTHMSSIGKKGAKVFYQRYELLPINQNQFGIIDRITKNLIAVI